MCSVFGSRSKKKRFIFLAENEKNPESNVKSLKQTARMRERDRERELIDCV